MLYLTLMIKDPDKRREYNRKWIANRRHMFFCDKHCVRCGSLENLELDHIDPSIKVDHKIWSLSRIRMDKELSKCQVLCNECHKKKTAIDKFRPITHGSNSSYTGRGCRCALCKAAHKESRANDKIKANGRSKY
jgi:hypothetical protein